MRTVRTTLFWVKQRVVVISYRRFRTIISPILALEDGTENCSEASVINYHYSLCNNPEESSSFLLRGRSMKSRKRTVFL